MFKPSKVIIRKYRLPSLIIFTIFTVIGLILFLSNINISNKFFASGCIFFLNIIYIECIMITDMCAFLKDIDISRRVMSPILISLVSIFVNIFGIILLYENINVYIIMNIIALLIFGLSIIILLQRKISFRKIRSITLKVVLIENLDYERERIFLKDEKNNDLYFIDYDLGDEIRIGEQYKIENLYKSDLIKDSIDFNNKKTKAYYIANINKDEFFRIKDKV